MKKFVKKHPEYHYLMVYLEVELLMMRHNLSYRGMVDDLNYNKTMHKKIGFLRTPSKSYIWWNVKLPIYLLDELLVQTAGEAA